VPRAVGCTICGDSALQCLVAWDDGDGNDNWGFEIPGAFAMVRPRYGRDGFAVGPGAVPPAR
jgi:hypothetical protein